METPVTKQPELTWPLPVDSRQRQAETAFAAVFRQGRAWRLAWLACGLLLALQSVWIFYLQRWLDFESPWNDRYAQLHCLVPAWCESGLLTVSHYGVLSALTAAIFFLLAFWGLPLFPHTPASALSGPVVPGPLLPGNRRTTITLFVVLAAQAIAYQAYLLVIRGQQIEVWLWLAGLGAVCAAALLWDMQDPRLLARTLGGLAALAGISLILLGVATMVAGRWELAWLALFGALLTIYGSAQLRPWPVPDRAARHDQDLTTAPEIMTALDIYWIAAIATGALALALLRAWSGRFAWVGDEWGFFEFGRALLADFDLWQRPFRTHDSNGYHTVFSSLWQAAIMQVAGSNVFGWRVSSILPVVITVPAVYVIGHWLGGRRTAVLSALAYAAGHMLLTFALVPYNNTQALPMVMGGLALLLVAERHTSALRYGLAGMVMGSGFLLFGLARLVAVPAVVLFFWPAARQARAGSFRFGWLALGGLAAAAPKLFDSGQWQDLLKATPVESEVSTQMSVAAQMARNTLTGLLIFFSDASGQTSHFVAGPHTDMLSAILILAGHAALLAAVPRQRALRWLVASVTFLVAVSAVQQYGTVAITRMFVLAPFYALAAGVGGVALVRCLLPGHRRGHWLAIALLATVLVVVNQIHIERISLPNSRDSFKFFNRMTHYILTTAPADGSQRVTAPRTVVIVDHTATLPIKWIEAAYELAPEQLVAVYADKAGRVDDVCGLPLQGASVLVMANLPSIDHIRTAMSTCHPSHRESAVTYPDGVPLLYRYAP